VAGDRLTGREKRALLLWVLAGVIGALVAYKYYFKAFPEADVNFQVSREEALSRARQFVEGMGENVGGYQSAIVFDLDDEAKTYLERELGPQKTNELMSSQLHIWYWDVRFFRPQQEEEFRVRVSPAGQVVGYDHHVAENSAGGALDRAAALAAATQFVSAKLGGDLRSWDLLAEEVSSKQRPQRLDWSFTWEKQGFRAAEALYRLDVELHGSNVGRSQEFLKIPEAWQRSFAQLRARNNFLATAAILPYILILGAAFWLSIALTRRGAANWRGAVKIGALVTFLLFCMSINEWPQLRAAYNTNTSYPGFILEELVKALLFGLGSALTITLVLPAADALYRVTQLGRLRLNKAFTWRGVRSKEFFCSAVVGLCLTAASLGFVVVFYFVGKRFGVWAPQDITYTNSVSTLFPWISGVAIGLLASTNEEFTFRMFAIPLVERLTGSRWLAVIIPAFCWSFLHANYPQEPPYIRGLEVGILGIVTGLVMLRWGILATLIWHYTFDASQVGLLLIRSHSWYFKISGIVVGAAAVAPLLFSAISYLQRGGFEPDEDLLNRAEPAPDLSFRSPAGAAEESVGARRYVALAPAMLGLLGLLTVCGIVVAVRLKPASIGEYLQMSVDARGAKARGDEILRARRIDPNSYRHAVVFVDNTDPFVNEYLRERIGIAQLNDIYASQVPGALWRVRYFRDSEKEEYAVILKPDGSLHSLWHVLAEDTPGAQLSKEAAQTIGEKYLSEEKHLDLRKWKLVDAESDQRPHRVDHTLVWEEQQPLDLPSGEYGSVPMYKTTEHAHARVRVQVDGDQITRYQTFIKIPDEWTRKQQALNLPRLAVAYGAPMIIFCALGIAMLVIFLRNLRTEAATAIPWRRLALWSLWGLAGFFAVFALGDRISEFLNSYSTSAPLKLTIGGLVIGLVIGGPFYFAGITLLFALAWFFARKAFAEEQLPGWLGMPALYYRDALFIGVGGTTAFVALRRLTQVIFQQWPTAHREISASFGSDFDATLPAGAVLGSALLRGLFLTGLVTALAAFVAAYVPQRWLRAVLLVGGALALVGGGWGNSADYVKQFAAEFILLGVIAAGVRYVMKLNLLGCFLVVAASALLGAMSELLGQQQAYYRANGLAVMAALVLMFAWPLVLWMKARGSGPTASA
jgi:membrane protease YdiL (CAAX protease family)